MHELGSKIFDATLIDGILKLIPGLTEGLEAGIDVADIACGSGHAANLMARHFPNGRFTGFDFAEDGLASTRRETSEWGLTNARFIARDVATLDVRDAYDFITIFDAIHDQAHPRAILKNSQGALRPGGILLAVDVRLIAGGEHRSPARPDMLGALHHALHGRFACYRGEGLGNMWGQQKARELLAEAGFTPTHVKKLDGDFLNNYDLCTRS